MSLVPDFLVNVLKRESISRILLARSNTYYGKTVKCPRRKSNDFITVHLQSKLLLYKYITLHTTYNYIVQGNENHYGV